MFQDKFLWCTCQNSVHNSMQKWQRQKLWFSVKLQICCGSISPLVNTGMLFILYFIFIIIYYHTPGQREILNCPKGKIEPQHTHYLVWILFSKGIKFDFDNTLYLFAFAGICYSLFGSVTAWNVQYKRASWPRLSSRTTLGKDVSSTSKVNLWQSRLLQQLLIRPVF